MSSLRVVGPRMIACRRRDREDGMERTDAAKARAERAWADGYSHGYRDACDDQLRLRTRNELWRQFIERVLPRALGLAE